MNELSSSSYDLIINSRSGSTSSYSYFTCEICIEQVPLDQKFKNDAKNKNKICEESHLFCSGCIAKYIKEQVVYNNISEIKCPDTNCDVVLDPLSCRSILPPRVFERWCYVLCESAVVAASAHISVYCPFPDCSELILDECSTSSKSNSYNNSNGNVIITMNSCSKCPNCRRLFCFPCQIPWQENHQCSNSGVERIMTMEERNDILFMRMVPRKKWTRCPTCKHYIERTKGCEKITCRCKTKFCYICGINLSLHESCACRSTDWMDSFMYFVIVFTFTALGLVLVFMLVIFFLTVFFPNIWST